MADWQQTYDPRDLNDLSRKAKQIRDTAALLGVSVLGLAFVTSIADFRARGVKRTGLT